MSTIDEDQIRDRLKALSQAGPTQEATDRAMEKIRDVLTADEARRVGPALNEAERVAPPSFSSLMKLAAAAVLMIGLGYLGGRLSAPAPIDAEQLRADIESSLRAFLEPAIRQDLLKEMDTRWDSAPAPLDAEQLRADIESSLRASLEPAIRQGLLEEMDTRWESDFAARSVELKDEFQQQVRRDLMEFAAQTLAYAGSQTDQRLAELIQEIHTARVQDRKRVEEALQYLESNRLLDKRQFGSGLVTLAARTNELMNPQQN